MRVMIIDNTYVKEKLFGDERKKRHGTTLDIESCSIQKYYMFNVTIFPHYTLTVV